MVIKIFLASSAELKDHRTEFDLFVSGKNKEWFDRGIFLELIIWEDFLDAVSRTRLQDEYNRAIKECDLFVMLFCTKVGKYTEEEFETAFGQFQATNKPLIFTYFFDREINLGMVKKEDMKSLWSFQEKLETLGHFQTVYKNVDQLKFHFNQQLDKLEQSGFFKAEPKQAGGAVAVESPSDLNISPLTAPRRLTPLDGHPVLSPETGPSPVYTGGFNVSFTLAHNGEGKHPINLYSMELEVVEFTPGTQDRFSYGIEGKAVIGTGMAKPHVFSVTLFGKQVTPAQWVIDASRGTCAESKSSNFFDTNDPRILTFAADGADIEEIRGTVLAQEPGLYRLRFVFNYSVAGLDRSRTTEEIHVYADE